MWLKLVSRGSAQTSGRAPGLPAPPCTCKTPFSLFVMNFTHSQAASVCFAPVAMPWPAPESCVPYLPVGPFGITVAAHWNFTRVWPALLYSATRPGVDCRIASLPASKRAVGPPVRVRLLIVLYLNWESARYWSASVDALLSMTVFVPSGAKKSPPKTRNQAVPHSSRPSDGHQPHVSWSAFVSCWAAVIKPVVSQLAVSI